MADVAWAVGGAALRAADDVLGRRDQADDVRREPRRRVVGRGRAALLAARGAPGVLRGHGAADPLPHAARPAPEPDRVAGAGGGAATSSEQKTTGVQ
ncbi:hypothetical protein CURTO8I2_200070 [Curtobacterium sp. 8I-2]|nr:hypothetical protein CURTO8I2_200070 [Curtobacterium sp. 8I-2]